MSRDDTINMEHYEILSLAHKICNECQKLSKRCPGGLCGNAVRKAKEIYYSQFAKDKKVRANGMREKQIEETIEYLNNAINVERNSYFGKGCITMPLIEADKILDILQGYRKQSEPISCGHEKGGEWVKLPCKVGDTLYVISQMKDKRILPFISEYEVTSISVKKKSFAIYHEMDGYIKIFRQTDFGKTVFLTKEEAERAVTDTNVGSK